MSNISFQKKRKPNLNTIKPKKKSSKKCNKLAEKCKCASNTKIQVAITTNKRMQTIVSHASTCISIEFAKK